MTLCQKHGYKLSVSKTINSQILIYVIEDKYFVINNIAKRNRCIAFILVSFPVIYILNDMNLANVITASLHVACQALNLHVVLLIGNLYLFVIYI